MASSNLYFVLPDFSGRSIWGISTSNSFGYNTGMLPNITGSIEASDNNVTTQFITDGTVRVSGCFSVKGTCETYTIGNNTSNKATRATGVLFTASDDTSMGTSLYQSNYNIVQPTSVNVLVKTRCY